MDVEINIRGRSEMPIDFDKMHEDAIAKAKKQNEDAEKQIRDDALLRNTAREEHIEILRDMIGAHLQKAQQTLELKGLKVQLYSDLEFQSASSNRPPEIWIQIYKVFDGDRPQYAYGVTYTCDNGKICAQTTEGLRDNLKVKNADTCEVDPIQCEQLVERTIGECLELLLQDS